MKGLAKLFLRGIRRILSPYVILWLAILCAQPIQSWSQVLFGTNNYIEYQIGRLPVVISVPHGGALTPVDIPDRTCNNPTTVTDANTIALGRQIDSAFVALTGCHPHMIYCHLKRTKLDCNRNLADGACGNAIAETAWHEFQDFIDTAQGLAANQFGGNVFYIDLHGHGHAIQRLELGYQLSAANLGQSDSTLNTPGFIANSSIQALVGSNVHSLTHAELLNGAFSLGTILGNSGYPSVPSLQIHDPGTDPYFSGGYNSEVHTCYTPGNVANGLQIECNMTGVRDNYANRKAFGDTLAAALMTYLDYHLQLSMAGCDSVVAIDAPNLNRLQVFPTVFSKGMDKLTVRGLDAVGVAYAVFSPDGRLLESGDVTADNTIRFHMQEWTGIVYLMLDFPSGPQFVKLSSFK